MFGGGWLRQSVSIPNFPTIVDDGRGGLFGDAKWLNVVLVLRVNRMTILFLGQRESSDLGSL